MTKTRRSAAITQGPSRAPARAMFKAVGFTDADLKRPIIGVANTWIEIGPCNYHLRRIAHDVKEGIRAAGGTPMEFNTVSISDGITMGSEGMRASLVSREVVADSIELVARGNLFDGLVVLVGCGQDHSGWGHGPGATQYSGASSLWRFHRTWALGGPRRHDSRCVRGSRNPCRRGHDGCPVVRPRR